MAGVLLPVDVFLPQGEPLAAQAGWYQAGGTWTYRRAITIDHTKVSNTDQTNFPLLVSFTDGDLKTAGNGGYVQNANGYDIIFTSSDGSTKLDHEIERYTASTGEIVMWVRIPTLSHSADTVIYLYYGNSAITTSQENKTGVWDSNYEGVWHLNQDPGGAAPQMTDSSLSANHGTSAGSMTSADKVTGKAGYGLDFDGMDDLITTNTSAVTGDKTISAWVNTSVGNANQEIFAQKRFVTDSNFDALEFRLTDAGNIQYQENHNGAISQLTTAGTLPLGNFVHVTLTSSGATREIYVNGTNSDTGTFSSSPSFTIDANGSAIGALPNFNGSNGWPFKGSLDEVRVYAAARSADWIKTEYNNQSDPASFYALGSTTTGSGIDHFVVSGTGTQAAGGMQTITITAVATNGVTAAAYTGSHSLVFSGAGSVGTYAPTCAGMAFGTATALNFTDGVATCTLALFKAETADIGVSDGTYTAAGHALSVIVSPASLSSLSMTTPALVYNDKAFTATIVARDAYGNPTGDGGSATSLVLDHGYISPSSLPAGSFTYGTGPDGQLYSYKANVTLRNNVASALSGYQAKLTIDTASLISAGKMLQSDCDDLRFSETDGTNIPYWIESGCNTANTTVWIKTDLPAAATKTVYMYSGNAEVGPGADGSAVFLLFDDFDALDTNKWNRTVSGSGAAMNFSGGAVEMVAASRSPSTSQLSYKTNPKAKNTTTVFKYSVRYKDSPYAAIQSGLAFYYEVGSYVYTYAHANQYLFMNSYSSGSVSETYSTPASIEVTYTDSQAILKKDGAQLYSFSCTPPDSAPLSLFSAGEDPNQYGYLYSKYYYIYSRQYIAAEPSVTIGASFSNVGTYEGNFTISGVTVAGNDTVTVTVGGVTTTADVYVDMLDHFVLTGASSQAAGSSQTITITATGTSGSAYAYYAGDHAITFSGPQGVGVYQPTCSDNTGADIPLGVPTTLTFSSGVATCSLKLYKEENSSVGATDQAYDATGHELAVSVSATPTRFVLGGLQAAVAAGEVSALTLAAVDAYGNTVSGYAGDKSITFSGVSSIGAHDPTASDKSGADIPFGVPATLAFSGGVSTADLKLYRAGVFTITLTDGAVSASQAVTVASAPLSTFDVSAPGVVYSGYPFSATIAARDQYGNPATDGGNATSIAVSSGSISPASIPGGSFNYALAPDGQVYDYRTAFTVTNNVAAALTGYQVKLTLDTKALIASGKLQQLDCDDMRFSEMDGTNVPYWIESGCNQTNTIVWIKTDLPAGVGSAKTVYLYTGSASVSSASSGAAVFPFFDDFSGSMSQWTLKSGSAITPNSGVADVTNAVYWGNQSFGLGYATRARLNPSSVNNSSSTLTFGWADEMAAVSYNHMDSTYRYKYYTYAGSFVPIAINRTIAAGSWYIQEVQRNSASQTKFYVDDVYDNTATSQISSANGSVWMRANISAYHLRADWVLVRQIASAEPTVALGTPVNNAGAYAGSFTLSGLSDAGNVDLTFTNGGVNKVVTLLADVMDHFVLTGSATQISGTSQTVTITAMGQSGNIFAAYAGDHDLTFSGPGSIGAYVPTATNKSGVDIQLGDSTALTFTGGVATSSLKLYKNEAVKVNATDGTYSAAGHELAVSVSSDGTSFVLSAPSPVTAGADIPLTVSAQDIYGNVATGYTGLHNLTFSGASSMGGYAPSVDAVAFGTSTSLNFTSGSATAMLRLYQAGNSIAMGATDGTRTGSLSLDVTPASLSSFDVSAPGVVYNGYPFSASIAARDAFGNPTSDGGVSTSVAASSGSVSPASIPGGSFNSVPAPDGIVYGYKTPLAITNQVVDNVTGYQVKLVLDTNALIASGKMGQSDCDDLRFFEADGTSVPYWIESGCNTNSTIVWIKTDLAAGVGAVKTVYMYTGNVSVGSATDGSSVFPFFDDFSGSSLNAIRWPGRTGSYPVSGGFLTMTGSGNYVYGNTAFGNNYAVRTRASFTANGSGNVGWRTSGAGSRFLRFIGDAGSSQYQAQQYNGSSGASSSLGASYTGYHSWEIRRSGTTSDIFAIDDVQLAAIGSYKVSDTLVDHLEQWGSGTLSVDWTLVRQYAATEPTVAVGTAASNAGIYTGSFTISGLTTAGNVDLTFTTAGVSKSVTLYADVMDHFAITGSATQTAGQPQTITVTAVGQSGNIFSAYTGDHNLTFSGPNNIGAYVPTATNKSGVDIQLGSATTLTFTGGVATTSLKLYKDETAKLNAADGTYSAAGHELTVTVSSDASTFAVSAPGSVTAGEIFIADVTAYDGYGNLADLYTGDRTLYFSGASPVGANAPAAKDKTGAWVPFGNGTVVTFSRGAASVQFVLYKAEKVEVALTDAARSAAFAIEVSSGPLTGFNFNAPATVYVDTPFTATVIARDQFGNPTDASSQADLSLARGTISPATLPAGSFSFGYGPDGQSYGFKREVTITNNVNAALAAYQTKFTLDTAAMIEAGEMQSDCDDLRFGEEDGTNVPYWIEQGTCNSANTTVWVKTSLPAAPSAKKIIMYHGNPNVGSASNATDVFIFYDDFESGLGKWTGGTIINDGGDNVLRLTVSATSSATSLTLPDFQNVVVESRFKFAGFGGFGPRFWQTIGPMETMIESRADGSNSSWHQTWLGTTSDVQITRSAPAWSTNIWYDSKLTTTNLLQKWDVASTHLSGTYSRAATISGAKLAFGTWDSDNDLRFSWVMVRQYAPAEPTVSIGDAAGAAGLYQGSFTISGLTEAGPDDITIESGGVSTTATLFVDVLDHLAVSGSSAQTAGQSQTITVTAVGQSGNAYAAFTGEHAITFSGAQSIGAYHPTCSDRNGADVPLGSATVLTFTNGVATTSLKLYKTEDALIGARESVYSATGHELEVSVTSSVTRLEMNAPAHIAAGTAVAITLTASDDFGNYVASYDGDHEFVFAGASSFAGHDPTAKGVAFGSPTPLVFSAGKAPCDLLLYKVETAALAASSGGLTANASVIVDGSALDHFDINLPAQTKAGVPFDMNITARDLFGNPTGDVPGETSVTIDQGTLNGSSIPASKFQVFFGPDGIQYSYRRQLTLTELSGSNLAGYQVKLTLDTASLISSGRMAQSDCDDLRFAEADGTDIPYWIESGCNSAQTVVWIKTDLPASSTKTVYMYYGSAGATSAADGGAVFSFFDDFGGSAVDAAKWTVGDATGVSVADGLLNVNSSNGKLVSTSAFTQPRILDIKWQRTASAPPANGWNPGGFWTSSSNQVTLLDHGGNKYYRNDGTWINTSGEYPGGVWLKTEYKAAAANLVNVRVSNYATAADVWNIGDITNSVSNDSIMIGRRGDESIYNQSGFGGKVDFVLVRQYVSAEPAVQLGDESAGGSVTFNVTVSGILQDTEVTLGVTCGSVTSSASMLVEAADHMHHFRVEGSGSQVAGGTQTVAITAIGESGDPFVLYSGSHELVFSGANSIGAYVPTASGAAFGSGTALNFTQGVAHASLVLYKEEAAAISVTDGKYGSAGNDLGVDVSPADVSSYAITLPAAAVSETAFPLTLALQDAYGNTVTAPASDIILGASGGVAVSPDSIAASGFASGSFKGDIILSQVYADANVNVTFTCGAAAAVRSISVTGVDHMDHWALSAGNQTAGNTQTATITAIGKSGNKYTAFSGDYQAVFSGANPIGSFVPQAGGAPFGAQVTLNFASGIATLPLQLYKAETANLALAGDYAASLSVVVTSAPLDRFELDIPAAAVNNVAFAATVTTRDAFGNQCTNLSGNTGVSVSGGAISPASIPAKEFSDDGIYAANFTISKIYSDAEVSLSFINATVTATRIIAVSGVDRMDHFVLSGSANQMAGETQTVTITATMDSGAVATAYTGSHELVFSGASSVGGNLPTADGVTFGAATSIDFEGGVAIVGLRLFRAGASPIDITDGSYNAVAHKLAVDVTPAPASSFAVSAPATVVSAVAFPMTVTAQDLYTNTVTSFSDSVSATTNAGALSPASFALSGGTYAGSFTLSGIAQDTTATLTIRSGIITSTKTISVIGADEVHHFVLSGSANQTAGEGQTLTITAISVSGNVATDYAGAHNLVFSGASSVGGHIPSADGVAFGSSTPVNFTSGVATVNLVLYKAGSAAINLSEGSISATGHTLTVSTAPAAASAFSLSVPNSVANSASFLMGITAQDAFTNTASIIGDDLVLSVSTGSISPATLSRTSFTNGSYSGPFAISGVAVTSEVTIDIDAGAATSNKSITVIGADEVHHFVLSGSANQTAGEGQTLTITAISVSGNVATDYAGAHNLVFSGASSVGGHIPSADGVAFGSSTPVNFTSGVATVNLVLYKAGSAAINLSEGSISATGHTLTVSTAPAAASTFSLSVPHSAASSVAFDLTVTAQDAFTNPTDSISDDPVFTVDVGSITPSTLSRTSFTNGSYSGPFTISGVVATSDVAVTFVSGVVTLVKYISVYPTDQMDHLHLEGASVQTAGSSQLVTVTAVSVSGRSAIAYSGPRTLVLGGAGSIGVHAPTACGAALGTEVTLNFTSGVATLPLVLFKAEEASITATDGTYGSDQLDVKVSPAALGSFNLSAPAAAVSGTPFTLALEAFDIYGNLGSDAASPIALSVSRGTVSPAVIAAGEFAPTGAYAGEVTISGVLLDAQVTLTATSGRLVRTASIAITGMDVLDHFILAGSSTQVAGTSQTITVTALGQSGQVFSSYAGEHSLVFSGADGIGMYFPSCTDQDGGEVYFGSQVPLRFTGGVATTELTLYRAGSSAVSASAGHELEVEVTPDSVRSFAGSVPTVAASGIPFILTLAAKDLYGNDITSIPAATDLAVSQGTISPVSVPGSSFTDGAYLGEVTISGILADTPVILTVRNGSVVQAASLTVTGVDLIHHLRLTSNQVSMVAGDTALVQIALVREDGSVYSDFTGYRAVTLTGAELLGGHQPVFTDKDLSPVAVGSSGILEFVSGVATTRVTLFRAGNPVLQATDGYHDSLGDAAYGLSLTVMPGDVALFTLDSPGSATVGEPFALSFTALDQFGNPTTRVADDMILTVSAGEIDTPSIPAASFAADGTYISTLTLSGLEQEANVTLTATSGAISQQVTIAVQTHCGGGSVVFIPPKKPDISATRVLLLPDQRLTITGIPPTASFFAVSLSPDFPDGSWQPIGSADDCLNLFAAASKLYLKFRSLSGGVSDVIVYVRASALSEGDIVKTGSSFDVYVIKYKNGKQYRRLLLSPSVFASYLHLKWENLKVISTAQMNQFTISSLVQVAGDSNFYQLFPEGDTGWRRIFPPNQFYDPDSVYEVNAVDLASYAK